MNRSTSCILVTALLLTIGCKGNPHTTSGDSTGTGAGGARVPGFQTKDTTKQQPGGPSMDTTKNDSIKK